MNATTQIEMKPSLTPVHSNLLQRKCACGSVDTNLLAKVLLLALGPLAAEDPEPAGDARGRDRRPHERRDRRTTHAAADGRERDQERLPQRGGEPMKGWLRVEIP